MVYKDNLQKGEVYLGFLWNGRKQTMTVATYDGQGGFWTGDGKHWAYYDPTLENKFEPARIATEKEIERGN